MPPRLSRRRLLRSGAAALAAGALAGCLDDASPDGTDRPAGDDSPGGTPTTGDPTATPSTNDPTAAPTSHASPTDAPPEGVDRTPTERPPDRTATTGGPRAPVGEVSYDRVVTVENRTDGERTFELVVSAASERSPGGGVSTPDGPVYHAERYTVAPGERDVFDFRDLDLAGDRRLAVAATHDGTTERETVRTVACYSDVFVAFGPDGRFDLYYAVC
jgi:hypothetical protein